MKTGIRELLPIGSVVRLNGAEKPLMIYGIRQSLRNSDVEYDYIGVPYPEGNMGPDSQFLFDHDKIVEILARGLETDEQEAFVGMLERYEALGQGGPGATLSSSE